MPTIPNIALMRKAILLLWWMCLALAATTQPPAVGRIIVPVVNSQQVTLPHATVELLRSKDSSLVKAGITDSTGMAIFDNIPAGHYLCRISMVNYKVYYTATISFTPEENGSQIPPVVLQPTNTLLKEVTVSGRKPFIQQLPDKTIVNVDAGITNAGTTLIEVLEKLPGVIIDRAGNISLKGRAGVLILIDGKQTYVNGGDLNSLLSSMNSSQVDQIEIMDNPAARYDAAGNAGIINIKTKKNKQKGFNGSINVALGQGVYPKNNNSLQLNYRTGAFNFFLNYSMNANKTFMDLYALRTYYKEDNHTIDALLEQPTLIKSHSYNHTVRTGMDYAVSKKTTLGLTFNGMTLERSTHSTGTAFWMNKDRVVDSVINTNSSNSVDWRNGGINFNVRHTFNSRQELTADLDLMGYRNNSHPLFQNRLNAPGGYEEALKGYIPSRIQIYSGKADYTERFDGNLQLETGWKTSHVNTNNRAEYFYNNGTGWNEDLGKTNHFLYSETIHALYANVQKQSTKWMLQGGLRYEYTTYDANQLGNRIRKDSAFSRHYHNLFPNVLISYKADTLHQFSMSAGRRIDRPLFQKLNPFLFVLNKYTYERGNPYYLPQYTWNFELTHQYKELLTTSLSYSHTTDYFSQIFLNDSNQTMIYTEGNVGSLQNIGLSVSVQTECWPWWLLSASMAANHKKIKGFV
jgi:iron complex outermembrane receptor protein